MSIAAVDGTFAPQIPPKPWPALLLALWAIPTSWPWSPWAISQSFAPLAMFWLGLLVWFAASQATANHQRPGPWWNGSEEGLNFFATASFVTVCAVLEAHHVLAIWTDWPTLPANELAGLLLLTIPVCGALACSPHASLSRRAWAGVTATIGVWLLLASESRGALAAGFVAALTLASMLNRRARWWLLAGTILAVALAPPAADNVEGGLNDLLSGRPEIWQRATLVIADLPLTGVGLGNFAVVVPAIYPWQHWPADLKVEDAHNLYLQITAELGLPGLLLFLWLVARALRGTIHGWHTSPRRSWQRLWNATLLAALASHLLWGLADAVSPGAPASLLLWWFLGLTPSQGIFQSAPTPNARRKTLMLTVFAPLLCGFLGLLGLLGPPSPAAHLKVLRHLVRQEAAAPPMPAADLDLGRLQRCSSQWLRGSVAELAGDLEAATEIWRHLLDCSAAHLPLVAVRRVTDSDLASFATERWPQQAESWFWLARSQPPEAASAAVSHYQRGLRWQPDNGLAWFQLAELLAFSQRLEEALDAYDRGCQAGDPGANSCLRGGLIAERIGQTRRAVELFRRSRWPAVQQHAERLEGTSTPRSLD